MAWREIAGETFVVDLARHKIYGLNEAGASVWRAITAGEALSATIRRLAPAAAHLGAVSEAVSSFVGELLRLGLVTGEGPAGDPPSATRAAAMSLPGFTPPGVAWAEELAIGAGSCAKIPVTSFVCDSAPKLA